MTTYRTDARQIGLDGTKGSAIQAQASRDAGRGTLRGKVPQLAPGGMFDHAPEQGALSYDEEETL